MKRFWDKVDVKGPDDCWEWQDCTGSHGYGKFTQGRAWEMLHHRMAYTLRYGEIPEGQVVRHKCDNRLCANPHHLELGRQGDNVRDMFKRRKGKWKKLDLRQAQEIKRRVVAGERGKDLAVEFGVSTSMVSAIKTGAAWQEEIHCGN